MTVKLVLAYTGTNYAGWQIQDNAKTVQGELENALQILCGQKVRVHGASRTDAGVHALGQVAHFSPPQKRQHIPWQKALNALLPKDISVLKAEEVNDNFHSRFSAKAKIYSYIFWIEPNFVYPQRLPFVWECGGLDLEAIKEIKDLLVGMHDFGAFMNAGTPVKTTVRAIHWLELNQGFYPQEINLRIKGDGFLKQMVRNIAGLFWLIGKHKVSKDFVFELLENPIRQMWPPTAPAKGLTLEKIFY